MLTYPTLSDAYGAGLNLLLDQGNAVPSVVDPMSKASGFGQGDRPYRELIAHSFRVDDAGSCLIGSDVMPANLAYGLGLLAWSLDGRNDVSSLAYYRKGAIEYSDDEHTLSGAFGQRIYSAPAGGDQLAAILTRIQRDPTHRRTFALVLDASDNFRSSREYPCAVGVQLFLRDGALTWLTVMRAQQALTVLPYDAFLFMCMHQIAAGLLDVDTGPYIHQAGTYHIYDDEIPLTEKLLAQGVEPLALPPLPWGRSAVATAVKELICLERDLRRAAEDGDVSIVKDIVTRGVSSEFLDVARACLATQAYRRLGDTDTVVESAAASPQVNALIGSTR